MTMVRVCIFATVTWLGYFSLASAEEGMWLFNNPPKKQLKQKYGFEPDEAWYAHLQRASVRFNSGGSGSFVSSSGLVMTNHHVGADALQKMSSKDKDYVADGFYARTPSEEIRCVDLELNVLMSIEDVTKRIEEAVNPGMDAAAAHKARRAAMNTVEKESFDQTGLRSDVVTLYQGGLYHLYRYKKYTDVRLVFAPEQAIAFFGGDPDNFEYPRYDLDVCFFRVYEDGKPAKIEHYLKWSDKGVSDGDLVFVSGHPGRTDRLNTVAHLDFLRDRVLPYTLNKLRREEVLLKTFSERSAENARRAQDDLFGIQNSRKARLGGLAGLQDPAIMAQKLAEEKALRQEAAANAKVKSTVGDPWRDVVTALKAYDEVFLKLDLLERGGAFWCDQFTLARMIVRMVEEDQKDNADRLREYRESNRESLLQQLYSEAPIYDDLETVRLADSLGAMMELLGARDGLVQQVLAGKSPSQRAAALIAGTKLKDVALRKKLVEGGMTAIEASDDAMIQLARAVDGPAREVRRKFEEQVEEPLRQAYARLASALFALRGTDTYPDATFTLRLSYGTVAGCVENGRKLPPWTTIGGAFEHAEAHGHIPPFQLPKSWTERKGKLKLDTPLNFICTDDIIGGNSGSPVVNRKNEVVGLIFDGNLASLVWDYVYSDEVGRSLAVDTRGIMEALRKVYDAEKLADELGK